MYNIYFASPWFTKAQEEREERLKKKLRDLGFTVFSPKEASNISGVVVDDSIKEDVFNKNIENIDKADIIFVVTDGKKGICVESDKNGSPLNAIDAGTMIEAGYAYNSRKRTGKPYIVYYAETLGNNKFNLMLSQSGDIVITKYEDVDNLPKMINDIINNKSTAYKYKGIVE